jgi:hypothetical protein
MPDPTAIDRALCCGQTCGRARPDQGECVASTHGRRQLMGLEAAGYVVEQGWQPIETAPKDGTEVLVFDPDVTPGMSMVKSDWYEPGGVLEGWSGKPTYWRPLPGAPQ